MVSLSDWNLFMCLLVSLPAGLGRGGGGVAGSDSLVTVAEFFARKLEMKP